MSAINARAIRRGRLLERISQQRNDLRTVLVPVSNMLNVADQAMDGAERTRRWLRANPLAVGLGLFVLIIWRPKGAIRLAKNGFLGWRTWRLARRKLSDFLG
ncbi:MAG: hypothetical protein RL703_1030 [Pseudomonadota bacterium]|jgi:hypothetical protein